MAPAPPDPAPGPASAATAPLVFITGASSGIGHALATHYRQQGWRLALVARRAAELEAWARQQGWGPEACSVHAADVLDDDRIIAAAQACIATQGLPDVVIANAGISIGVDTALREDLAVMREVVGTNFFGTAATFHPFIAPMRARGHGTLVGVASVAAIRGLPGHGAYCGSKAAVVSYCESLRIELRGSGVRVVTLVPGYVDTPLTRRNTYPMPFLMQPADFAARAYAAVQAGASYRVIPWQMGVAAKLMRLLPNAWHDRAFSGRGRKKRHSEM
jgi:short-subunit dehydrogenase